jgi:hypothetical protein
MKALFLFSFIAFPDGEPVSTSPGNAQERFQFKWNRESALSSILSHFRTANRFPLRLEML